MIEKYAILATGGPRGRVGKVAEFQLFSFDHLTAVSSVGLSPALATCETSQVLLAGVSGGFPGVLPFRSTYRLARLDMSEIILKRDVKLNKNKKLATVVTLFSAQCAYLLAHLSL